MKILNIIQCTELGGMEQASLRLMRSLKRRGHELSVISLNRVGPLGELLAAEGIDVTGLSYVRGRLKRNTDEIVQALAAADADSMIVTGHNLAAFLALGSRCAGRRVLSMHFHHAGVKPSWQWRLLYELAVRRFNHITFPSDFVRLEAETICGGVAEISRTVRNPLPIQAEVGRKERNQARVKMGCLGNALVVGNAGWLVGRKRFDVFLRTAAKILEVRPDAVFIIAGDGPDRPLLEELAERLNIARSVHWLGWQSDLGEFYRAIDVLLFASDADAYPTTPLEAMSFGCPVVASSKFGGLREVITGKDVGWFFDDHDIGKLAEAVLVAATSEGERIGLLGKARVEALSNGDMIAEQFEPLLLGNRTGAQ